MDAGEISVDLRLAQGKLRGDIAQARREMTNGFRDAGLASPPSAGLRGILSGRIPPRPPVIPPVAAPAGESDTGGGGLSLASGFSRVARWLTPVAIGLAELRTATRLTTDTFRRAAETYASIIRGGGMGAGFVVQRNLIAGIMGISPDEILKAGEAFERLNAATKDAQAIFVETNSALTATTFNWRVMTTDFRAMLAKAAEALAPLINEFTQLIDDFIKSRAGGMLFANVLGQIQGALFLINKSMELAVVGFRAAQLGLTFFLDALKAFIHDLLLEASKLVPGPPGMLLGAMAAETFGPADFADAKKRAQQLKSAWARLTGAEPANGPFGATAPAVPTNINRLPGSPFERMGLVLGIGGGTNYAKETAKNTKTIADFLTGKSGQIPRGATTGQQPVFNSP